jgi:hypothetical protein
MSFTGEQWAGWLKTLSVASPFNDTALIAAST